MWLEADQLQHIGWNIWGLQKKMGKNPVVTAWKLPMMRCQENRLPIPICLIRFPLKSIDIWAKSQKKIQKLFPEDSPFLVAKTTCRNGPFRPMSAQHINTSPPVPAVTPGECAAFPPKSRGICLVTFRVISWWFYGDFMVILWWFHGDFMVISLDLMVYNEIWWWFIYENWWYFNSWNT